MSGMMEIRIFTFNLFQEHTMVVYNGGPACVIIDPGFYEPGEKEQLFGWLEANGLVPEAVLLTHGHIDHITGVKETQDFFGGIPVYMKEEDRLELEEDVFISRRFGFREPRTDFRYNDVRDGQTIEAAGMEFKVITTPGHSPGSVCYLMEDEKILFTGDTLFAGTIGRTDFKYGDYDNEIRSIMEKLIWLAPEITIYPGHGGTSTIGVERTGNPMLEPFNEKEELEQSLSADELPHD